MHIVLVTSLAFALAEPVAIDVGRVDVGSVSDAVEEVLAKGKDVIRLAVPPVVDDNPARQKAVEIALVQAILDRHREDVITPAWLRAKLRAGVDAPGQAISKDELRAFSADHILVSRVIDQSLELRLLQAETGAVLGEARATLGPATARATATAASVHTATVDLVEQIAWSIESTGADIRTHRTAIAELQADPGAKEARLDRFFEGELTQALVGRGFLVVERAELAAAAEQLSLGQEIADDAAPKLGKFLGAQSLVVGQVAMDGTHAVVALRVLSAETGSVLGAARAVFPREGVVGIAAVETRTPLEAALRSVIAPGWGQAYNGEGSKALAFGIGGYGGAAATLALVASGIAAHAHYNDTAFFLNLPSDGRVAASEDAKGLAEGLYVSSAVLGGATAVIWAAGIADAALSAP